MEYCYPHEYCEEDLCEVWVLAKYVYPLCYPEGEDNLDEGELAAMHAFECDWLAPCEVPVLFDTEECNERYCSIECRRILGDFVRLHLLPREKLKKI